MDLFSSSAPADTVVVLDFETSGLSPREGDRAIEIGAVLLREGEIVDRFQELMNPGRPISSFIEQYTGITNEMLDEAPPSGEVMRRFAAFIGNHNLVAHNAAFDAKFLDAELRWTGLSYCGDFACSMLISRRLLQGAPNHKLGTLVKYCKIPQTGDFHRALADAEMTAGLWMVLIRELKERYEVDPVSFALMRQISKMPAHSIHTKLRKLRK